MTLPVREQAFAAFEALLAGIAAVQTGGGKVYRNRIAAPPSLPTLIMFDGAQEPPEESNPHYGITRYGVNVPVEIHVGAAGDELLGPAVSEILAQIIEAKTAYLATGAGVVEDVVEGEAGELVTDRRHDGAACYGVLLAHFRLVFETPYGKPRG